MTLIYVDVVEDEPQTRDEFFANWPQVEIDPDYEALCEKVYQQYLDRFQPFRVAIKSGDNEEPLFRSTESYFNRADAKHAARIGFGRGSNVYLRQHEQGNEELRLASDAQLSSDAFGLVAITGGVSYRLDPLTEPEAEAAADEPEPAGDA